RRRHTRSYGDWSSDVCSSDLSRAPPPPCPRRESDDATTDREPPMRKTSRSSRRRFLAVGTAAAALGFPTIAKSAGPLSMRCQDAWYEKDIFHEFALDVARKIGDMTGGDVKIQMLPAGAVAPAFGLLDAVSKGALDGAHGALVYHYGKQPTLALWGSGSAFGMDANMVLAWHKYGGVRALLKQA